MTTGTTSESAAHTLSKSRGWLIVGGILSIVVGFFAMGSPILFSIVIAKFLGLFALISGVISLFMAIFGKHTTHRVLDALFAAIRIAAGVILLRCIASGITIITLILAIYLIIEGASSIFGAFKLRQHKGWIWTLINGIAGLVLGIMVYAQWPSNAPWVLGLFYGIYSLFYGTSCLMLGLASPKEAT
jgi:uncharacterized membrane protein HdeD (DUF308 family)